MIGCYYESWGNYNLAGIDPRIRVVYLAFAIPSGSYKKGSLSFAGTGLSFGVSFTKVAQDIEFLNSKGVIVMLSVGGGGSPYPSNFQPGWVHDLVADLGCDGIDIDWEPPTGAAMDGEFGPLIRSFKQGSKGYLSAACWSTGAYGKNGDTFQGMNIKGIEMAGSLLDWINAMTYDAGKTFDPLGALACYRIYYKGQINLGIELGMQGWGDKLISIADVEKYWAWVKKEGNMGAFFWSYKKDTTGSPSLAYCLSALV